MEVQTTAINPPKTGTKQAKLVRLLLRKSGVTITKAREILGWQSHTVRAAFTGLRQRGYNIERRERGDKDCVYVIASEPASS